MVDDNPGDVRLAQEVLRGGDLARHLEVVEDGDAAIAFLRRQAPFETAPRPDLVLLDLNLPRRSGLEVLRSMKADDTLRPIPVVILSSSARQRDVAAAYDSGASCYIVKPRDLAGLEAAYRAIETLWCRVAALPLPR